MADEDTDPLEVEEGHGNIAIIGEPGSGKTAYLIALALAGGRSLVPGWKLRRRQELSDYVATLGDPVEDPYTGRWRRTLDRTAAAKHPRYLPLLEGHPRSWLPQRRSRRLSYLLALPDVPGETFQYLTGERDAEEEDRANPEKPASAARDQLLALLTRCRALICMVGMTGGEGLSAQVRGVDVVLTKVKDARRRTPRSSASGETLVDRLTVTIVLTKCDTLDPSQQKIRLPKGHSDRWKYFEDRGMKPLEEAAKVREEEFKEEGHKDDEKYVVYDLKGVDRARASWTEDPAHDDAVARDWLRCHCSDALSRVEDLEAEEDIDVELVIMSSFGGPCPLRRDKQGGPIPTVDAQGNQVFDVMGRPIFTELVPLPGDIKPIRLLAPIRSVLARLHRRRATGATSRTVRRALGVLSLAGILGPGATFGGAWYVNQLRLQAGQESLERAVAIVRWGARYPGLFPRRVFATAACGLGVDLAERGARETDEDRREQFEAHSVEVLQAAVRLGSDDARTRLTANRKRIIEQRRSSSPTLALDALGESREQLVQGDGIPLARELVWAELEAMRLELEKQPDRAGAPVFGQRHERLLQLCGLLVEPGFFLEVDEEPAASMQGPVAWVRGSQAWLQACGLALPQEAGAPPRDVRASVDQIDQLTKEAARHASHEPETEPETNRRVQAFAARTLDVLLGLPEFTLSIARAGADPKGEVAKLEGLEHMRSSPAGSNERRINDVLRGHEELLWQATLAARDDARLLGKLEPLSGCLEVLGELQKLMLPPPARAKGAECLARSLDLLRLAQRFRANEAAPEGAKAKVEKALELRTTVQPQSLEQLLTGDLDLLGAALATNPGALTEGEWREIAVLLVQPGSNLERALATARVEQLFSVTSDEFGRPSDEQLAALRSLLREKSWSAERTAYLTKLGLRLCAEKTCKPAFAFRAALEACAREVPQPSESQPVSELASEVKTIATGFRAALWNEHADEPEHEQHEAAFVDALAQAPTAMPDLVYLHDRLRLSSGDGLLYAAVLAGFGREIKAKTWLAYAERDSLLEVWQNEARGSIAAGTREPWHPRYRPVLDAACASAEKELQQLAALARLARLRFERLPPEDREELLARLLADPCSLALPDLELTCTVARALAAAPSTWPEALAIHAALVRAQCGLALSPLRWQELREALVPGDASPLLLAQITKAFEEYLNTLEKAPDGGGLELERLFTASRSTLQLPAEHRALVAKRLRKLEREETYFLARLEEVAKTLSSSAGGSGLSERERQVLIQALDEDIAEADKLEAGLAKDALSAVRERLAFLGLVPYAFVRIEDAENPVYIGRDEVSLRYYAELLKLDEGFTITFKRSTKNAELDYYWKPREGMSAAYEEQATEDGQIVWDQGVFGVDPASVAPLLTKRGVRLPSREEWLKALGTEHSALKDGAIAKARTPDQLADAGDVSPVRVAGGTVEIRGLRYGIREWVIEPSGKSALSGSSWWQAGMSTKSGEDRIDAGLRLALDELPERMTTYLSAPRPQANARSASSPSAKESR